VNPFAVLGLPAWPDLEDETVRAAWQAIAAQTHPDRPDGGDLARYTQASAAYAILDSPWGRSEAYADLRQAARARGRFDVYPGDADPGGPPGDLGSLSGPGPAVVVLHPVPLREVAARAAQIPARIRHGHPLRLLARAAATAGIAAAILTLFPSVPGRIPVCYLIAAFTLTFVRFGLQDLAPGPGPAGITIEFPGNRKE
jgi:hypothetical protein